MPLTRVLALSQIIALVVVVLPAASLAQPAGSIATATEGLTRQAGYIPFYWDETRGRVLMEIPAFDEDVLYYISAATGSGSVSVSLDRGVLSTKVIHFIRSGPKVLVEEQNLDFRAVGGGEARADNVRASFPTSVLAALPIEAEEGNRVLVDASSMFLRNAANLEARFSSGNNGAFRLDRALSGFYPARMKAFPENTEIETVLTYSISNAGAAVSNVVPEPSALTVRIHHSFLKAPEGYTPRKADVRIGSRNVAFDNYAAPIDDDTQMQWVTRWRLEKQEPDAAMSPPVEPIVFYLDPAIPDDIREAMRIGTLWWNEAFEQAGFIDAVQVRDPTPDMDPMDIRYAWVQWIERDERGFSNGGGYVDPRTGEIIGSKTRMDSHRIRTVANYWESYMPYAEDSEGMGKREMALLRQSILVAHELGHVLGFEHNWASSTNGRASVMEYPTPRVRVVDGRLDLSEAYPVGIGEYDEYLVRYGYTEFPDGNENEGLERIVDEMRHNGVVYVPGTDPRWAWYDDRETPTEYLRETMAARRILVEQYGIDNLEQGEPIGALRDMRLWMTYLHHRWAISAGQGFVGGMYHNYVLKGEEDAIAPTEIVPATLQREILDLLMEAIAPENLALPEELLRQLAPHPNRNLEDMSDNYVFDHLRAARILAALVIEPLFEPNRAQRLVILADRQADALSLPELVRTLLDNTWDASESGERRSASLRRVTTVVLHSMMILGAEPETTPQVRTYILDQIALLGEDLASRRDSDPMAMAHYRQSARDIARYLENPQEFAPESASVDWGALSARVPLPPSPPGAPL